MIFNVELDDGAIMPTKAHDTDAGYDLYARESRIVPARLSTVWDTGVHINIPVGYAGFIKSKSGLNVKHNLTADGVIDSGYTGSIAVKLYNHGTDFYKVNKGDKIAQIVFVKIADSELELSEFDHDTDRGDNGFGSSGR